MALDVYYRDDVAQQIVSVVVSMLSAAVAHGGGNIEYCRGVLDMARAQAVSYGIPWSGMVSDLRSTLSDAEQEVLLGMVTPALPEG